ncbi:MULTISPECIES: F0F1 ATP synthase subunit gamma [Acinetobacter]|uniref:ATP synthase gamma chain n=3 Tax=Acinetobacter haemolyticus TaxID=29430 RepID=A0A1L6KRI8_ACIHA|nr:MULTISPECIES: F0F1 ATP synthase subunit gamma [Acinetobacter]APR71695.1 F0F1 ATP synthase subunit gamma [Acinetobacter haemolyticus]ATZ68523.1 F0F1 ATP synthase subunit gamma [Acinetobacter haemolyticus]AZN67602.1 F0F1 ATP synthase subunit gamma [Acinetobacter haemolyticus]EEH69412.1 ATP synthase F1, gamma subunit [Acinetobacter sp. ATCC 27244]EFF84008.1 ATP synthase F1, gamma subunit [Acinetobacter haemolyticus ATCC 19194]
MANLKEIRAKVASIKSTQKITRAMQMVAASKMRRAQERMAQGRPYADNMRRVIAHLVQANPEYKHRYMVERPVKRVGYIVVSSDRGLAGGLNINLFKKVVQHVKAQQEQSIEVEFALIGQKAVSFFKSYGGKVLGATTQLGDTPSLEQLTGSVQVMLDAFDKGELDRIYLVSNGFVNAMTQQPKVEQLVPLAPAEEGEDLNRTYGWDYIYEPEAEELLNGLLVRYIESMVYQGVIENVACEQSARMVAMKAATDNAGQLIKDLQLIYNKLRQAAITQEISEIVGGAAAV